MEPKEKKKIEVGYIYDTGTGYVRVGDERIYLDIRGFEDLQADLAIVLNHYFLRKKGYKISKE